MITPRPAVKASFHSLSQAPSDLAIYAALVFNKEARGPTWRQEARNDPNLPSRVRDIVEKAVGAVTAGDLGTSYASANVEFLTGLRSVGLFDAALPAMRRVPRRTRVISATLISGGSVAEAAYKPLSSLEIAGQVLTDRKAAALLVMTDELATLAGAGAQTFFESELRRGVAAATDAIFVDALNDLITPIPSVGNDLDAIANDLDVMLTALALTAESRPFFALPAALALKLSLIISNGGFAFPGMSALGGTLAGFPAIVTDALAADEAMALDATKIAADGGVVLFDSASHAALQMSATPSPGEQSLVSLWQTNSRAARAERLFAFDALSSAAAVLLSDVHWGVASP
jgi:hypothetical protein